MVVRTVDRADPADVDALGGSAPPPCTKPSGGEVRRPPAHIQQAPRLAGPAVTVSSHPGDNLMIHAAVEVCRAGDVLVVTSTALVARDVRRAAATSLMARGVRALVIDAGVRTPPSCADGLRRVGATRVVPGHGEGERQVGQRAGGAGRGGGGARRRRRADDDGVVVVPVARRLGTRRARRVMPTEEASRARLRAGELGVDMYGLGPPWRRSAWYVDRADPRVRGSACSGWARRARSSRPTWPPPGSRWGYDPAPVPADRRHRHDDPVAAVESVDVVLALTAAADAPTALAQALDAIPGPSTPTCRPPRPG